MKKTLYGTLAVVFLLLAMTACGGEKSPQGSSKDYSEVIQAARSAEYNEMYPVITGTNSDQDKMVFDVFGGDEADMKKYALSIGLINIKAYGIAVILPEEGKDDQVKKQIDKFIESQKKSFENYLPDQYEIAKSALVEKAETGEYIMVMCDDAKQVMESIRNGLKA